MQRRPRKRSHKASGPPSRGTVPARNLAEAASELAAELDVLPEFYGRTRVVLLPVDPYLMHVYWEITPRDMEQARRRTRGLQYQAALRFHDISETPSDRANSQNQFDVDIELAPHNWYVRLWSPEKRYFVDLGLRTEDGSFMKIARSNVADTPRAQPSTHIDEHYLPITVGLQGQPAPPIAVREEALALKQGAKVPDQERARIAVPIDMAESVRRRLAELYGRQPQPPSRATRLGPPPPTGFTDLTEMSERRFFSDLTERAFSDLTEMNERSFAPGISSEKR